MSSPNPIQNSSERVLEFDQLRQLLAIYTASPLGHERVIECKDASSEHNAEAHCPDVEALIDQVIAAKDRARWAAKSPKVEETKRRMKAEMVEWMLVWLGDPAVFPAWVQLRRQNMG